MGDWARELLDASLSRLRAAWRGKDRPAIALYAALLLAAVYAMIGAYFLRASDDSLGIYLDEHRGQVFVGAVLLAILGLAALSRLASFPVGARDSEAWRGAEPMPSTIMCIARLLRWPLALGAAAGLIWFWQAWVKPRPFEPRPDHVGIYVARFYDADGDAAEGRRAQHAIVVEIENELRGDRQLGAQVEVRPLNRVIPMPTLKQGYDEARSLAARLGADLVVWGSVVKGAQTQYRVCATSASDVPMLVLSETAQEINVTKDPSPRELTAAPLLVARFVLGYASYQRGQYEKALEYFERVLKDLPGPSPDSSPEAAHPDAPHLLFLSANCERKIGQEGNDCSRLAEACKKYQAAVAIKQDYHAALHWWGLTLLQWAQLTEGAEAERLFAEACEKHEAGLEIKRDDWEAVWQFAWGATLSLWARRTEGAEAERLLAEACGKYEAALEIKPDYHEALTGWAVTLSEWAKRKGGAEAERLFGEACEKYEAAVEIKPDYHEALYEWGLALSAWAQGQEGAERERLLAEACEKYEAAVNVKPDYHEALYEWGLALSGRALRTEGEEAERLFAEACDKYEAAVEIKRDYYLALYNWGSALAYWARRTEGNEAERLWRKAREKALEADQIKPGPGAYLAACASARLGEEEECHRWLETALEHGRLPKRSHMETNPDLASVRDRAWFQQILAAAPDG